MEMRITLGAILIAIFVCLPTPEMPSCLTFHLYHGNVFHLAGNLLALWVMFPPEKDRRGFSRLLLAWLVASAANALACERAIGFSGIILALIGMAAPPLYDAHWRKGRTILFIAILLATSFIPGIAGLTHLLSFIGGMALAAANRSIRHLENDYTRLGNTGHRP